MKASQHQSESNSDQQKDELDIKFVEYPAGARFIGPGDDVVISAAKLQAHIRDCEVRARIEEMDRLNNTPMDSSEIEEAVGNYIQARLVTLTDQLTDREKEAEDA